MSEGLLQILDEQSVMSFTGKINVLREDNSQSIAVILMREGQIVQCLKNNQSGENALMSMIIADVAGKIAFKTIVEPEVVSAEEETFRFNVDDLKKKVRSQVEEMKKAGSLRPPNHLNLVIDSDFIIEGQQVEPQEFDILSILSDYSNVQEIYKNSPLLEHETTQALISLRKKGAIKVIGLGARG